MTDLSILINGVEFRNYVRLESIQADEAQKANGQRLSFAIDVDLPPPVNLPEGKEVVKFYFNGALEFAGRVETVDEIPSAPSHRSLHINCVDWTADFDAHLINEEFPSQLAGDMVRTLVGRVGRLFTSNNVVDGIVIAARQSSYELPSAIMSAIAESIEHQWYIDHERDVHFFFIDDEPAPVDTINLDSDSDTYFDFLFTRDYSQVRNRIYLTGAQAKSGNQHTDVVKGDGSDTRFLPLAYQPWDQSSVTVLRNGLPLNVKLDTVDGSAGDGAGTSNDCYLCIDNWGVRLPDNWPLANGETLSVSFNYSYEPVVVVEDPESIAIMKALEHQPDAPSDGVHEMVFSIPDLRVESEDGIFEYGQLLLLRHARGRIDASFGSWKQGWRPGQSFVATSTNRELDNRRFYVHSVSKRVLVDNDSPSGGHLLRYEIRCSTSPFPV